MSERSRLPAGPLADLPVEIAITETRLLTKAFRDYQQFRYRVTGEDDALPPVSRDILRAGGVAAVLPIDPARAQVVLLRQFRLAAHVATGSGDLVEIVAGRVEAGERPIEAAHRETVEEIGLAPSALVELFSYLSSPGLSDEVITVFLAVVDAAELPERAGSAAEREETWPMLVAIDAALAALSAGTMHSGPLIAALQWLGLNRGRLDEIVRAASPES